MILDHFPEHLPKEKMLQLLGQTSKTIIDTLNQACKTISGETHPGDQANFCVSVLTSTLYHVCLSMAQGDQEEANRVFRQIGSDCSLFRITRN